MNDRCRACTAQAELRLDKLYRQMVCSRCWEKRRMDAIANRHGEWLDVNGCAQELAELEKGDLDASRVDVESTHDSDIPGR